ncbi:hypothetical protein ABIE56_000264 [Luteibacter sp. 621]|uniref:hypothetical protein n=1 Tax=Luteibacter sp. 621 TaxID=3373916 RepID=UPI003D205EAD
MSKQTSPATQAAIVYLDSSDISELTKPDRAELKSELLALKTSGLAKFPFSDILVLECLPKDPDNVLPDDRSLQRIRTIAELSGLEHHPSAWSILDHEIRRVVAQHHRSRERPRLRRDWYYRAPQIPPLWDLVRKELMQDWRNAGASRNERRARFKGATRLLRDSKNSDEEMRLLDELVRRFPFRPGDQAKLLTDLKTSTNPADLNRLYREALDDIVNLSEWVVKSGDAGRQYVDELRAKARSMEEVVVEYFNRTKATHAALKAGASDNGGTGTVQSALGKMRDEWLDEVPRLMAAGLFGKEAEDFKGLPPLGPGTTPSLYALHDFIIRIIEGAGREKHPRNPAGKASHDYFDAMHAVFLPHVDIFRADGHTAEVLRSSSMAATKQLAASLSDIPGLVADHHRRA